MGIYIQLNEDGARLININSKNDSSEVDFGDSQILGIDWSSNDTDTVHDIAEIFQTKNLILYAAPNNNPMELVKNQGIN